MKKEYVIIFALVSALIILAQYIILNQWSELNQIEINQAYEFGYEKGLSDSFTALFQQTQNCSPTILSFNNFSRQVIDVDCISELVPP